MVGRLKFGMIPVNRLADIDKKKQKFQFFCNFTMNFVFLVPLNFIIFKLFMEGE